MALSPKILLGNVMHSRVFPRRNQFSYGIYYLSCPLSQISTLADGFKFGVNHPALLSFYDRDHGPCDGRPLLPWIRSILDDNKITQADGEIVLVTMPRVMGYVFNPVSFWICYDRSEQIRAVLCEVHNTFGERHSYLCIAEDGDVIRPDTWLDAEKLFHVSPFLKREGRYRFRFDFQSDKMGVWIDFHDGTTKRQLLTALTGRLELYTPATRRRAFWFHPLVTFKAIILIHWQAIKLLLKGQKYVPKPDQLAVRVSVTDNLTKN